MREIAYAAKRSLRVWIAAGIVVLLLAVIMTRTGWVDWRVVGFSPGG